MKSMIGSAGLAMPNTKTKKLTFFHWYGGKFQMIDRLTELIPDHEIYVEVFGGAASLLLNKPPSPTECYNDVNGDLVNLFRAVRDNPTHVLAGLVLLPYSRQLYAEFREALQTTPVDTSHTDPERAAKFLYCARSGFSGKTFGGWVFSRECRKDYAAISRSIMQLGIIHERFTGLHVDRLDFRRIFKNWDTPQTFFYCDPPYFVGGDLYGIPFTEQDQRDLAQLLRGAKGKWLLTIDENPLVRDLYKDYIVEEVDLPISVQRTKGEKRRRFINLIIRNYETGGWAKKQGNRTLDQFNRGTGSDGEEVR